MRRCLIYVFSSITLLASPAWGQNAELFTGTELAWIQAHPDVRIAIDPEWRPLEYVESGVYKGLSVEYLKAISRISGLTFQRLPSRNWKEAWDAFYSGEVDLMPTSSPIITSLTQREKVLFSKPYFVGSTILVTQAKAPIAFGLDELSGKKVAVKAGGALERSLLERFPKVEIVPVTNPGEALDKVAAGEADAALDSEAVFMSDIRRRHFGKLHVAGTVFDMPIILSMAVRKDDPILMSIIDKSLASMTALETDEIMNEWLESRDYWAPSWSELLLFYKYETGVVGGLLLCIAFLGYRTYEALRRAERSERDKAMFLAVMSHEIRTPMNVILSCVELLKRASLPAEEARLANVAVTSANTLLDLLSDILDFSKLEAGKLEIDSRPTDIGALIREVVEMSQLRALEKGLKLGKRLQLIEGRWAVIDSHRVRQTLVNVLSNAIKFTEQGEVTLVAKVAESQTSSGSGLLILVVTDTGVGIPKRHQAKLFKAFSQADASMARKFGGSGLGLTICRDLVHLMKGTITLESEVGKGTRVEILLPVQLVDEAPEPLEQPLTEPAALGGLKILVIEDHPENQFVIERQLHSLGHRATQELSGYGGLARAGEQTFDLILLDCNLPDIDGYAVASLIREQEAESGAERVTPIIAISAMVGEEHLEACFSAGFDGVLGKPLRLHELASIISLWCGTELGSEESLEALAEDQFKEGDWLGRFLAASAVDLDLLKQAVQSSEWAAARSSAHRIAGVAMLRDLPEIVLACQRVEQCIDEHDYWQQLQQAIEKLDQALNDVAVNL